MVRRIKQWLDDQMRDAPRPWNVIVPILAVGGSIFFIGSLIGYFVWYNLPSTVTYREHGLQLLRLEIAALSLIQAAMRAIALSLLNAAHQ